MMPEYPTVFGLKDAVVVEVGGAPGVARGCARPSCSRKSLTWRTPPCLPIPASQGEWSGCVNVFVAAAEFQ
jgi:hypothetical protein